MLQCGRWNLILLNQKNINFYILFTFDEIEMIYYTER